MDHVALQRLKPGSYVARKPAGRMCRVEKVDDQKYRMLIKDPNVRGPFWVKFDTLFYKWRIPGDA